MGVSGPLIFPTLPFPSHLSWDIPLTVGDASIVEANLLIMCGSLPTLRVFVSKVAPRILGDRSTNASDGRKDKSDSTSFGLRTFGGSNGPKRKFDTLVELEHDVHFSRSTLRPDGLGETDVNVHGGRRRHKDSETDSVVPETDSEEGILQTRTTTVTYAQRQSRG